MTIALHIPEHLRERSGAAPEAWLRKHFSHLRLPHTSFVPLEPGVRLRITLDLVVDKDATST